MGLPPQVDQDPLFGEGGPPGGPPPGDMVPPGDMGDPWTTWGYGDQDDLLNGPAADGICKLDMQLMQVITTDQQQKDPGPMDPPGDMPPGDMPPPPEDDHQ